MQWLSDRVLDLGSESSLRLTPETLYSKTCVKQLLLKRPNIAFHDQLSLFSGQKHCTMLQGEHSAILLPFIKLPFVISIFVLSIYEWPFCTGFLQDTILYLTLVQPRKTGKCPNMTVKVLTWI